MAPARRRLLLGLLGAALALALVGGVLAALNGRSTASSRGPVAQNVPGPVLLVPGYGGSVSGLNRLAEALRADGKDVTIVALPGTVTGDLVEQAEALGDAVTSAMARTGAASVDVVGYSAGGVVARIWAQDEGGAEVARRIVTLGSPHHGTQLADLGGLVAGRCPLACQQLGTQSDLLAGLQADGLPAGLRVVSIWSSVDDVVVPPESARLEGAVNLAVQSVCAQSRVSHGGLPADPVVQALVAEALAAAAVPTWGAEDCGRLSS